MNSCGRNLYLALAALPKVTGTAKSRCALFARMQRRWIARRSGLERMPIT